MVQNENGISNKKKINNEYKYLLQTKLEPGNINQLQISPTVQATKVIIDVFMVVKTNF